MASIKILKKIHDSNEKKSLVKELIALRPISPAVTRVTHPLETIYDDTNATPAMINQFAPYMSRKISIKRKAQIEKIKSKSKPPQETFGLTSCVDVKSHLQQTSDSPHLSTRRSSSIDTTRTDKSLQYESLQSHLIMEEAFDKIASNSSTIALHRLIESTLQVYFLAEKVLYYHDVSSVKVLYCPTTTSYFPHGTGLVGYSQYSRKTMILKHAGDHISFNLSTDGTVCSITSPVLIFPLFDSSNHVKGVVQVIREADSNHFFTPDDEKFVEYFQSKCQMYSRWFFQPVLDSSITSGLVQTCRLRQYIETVRDKLTHLFCCRGVEIYKYDKSCELIQLFTPDSDTPIVVPPNKAGIPGFALRQQVMVSCISARVHSAYNQKTDGNGDLSVLIIPVRDPDSQIIYAIALRGKRIPQFFTDYDEKILAKIAPYIISSLNSATIVEKNHKALKDSIHQQKKLRSLLGVAETLSGQLRMDVLIPNIMQRACELVKADRCSLFMVNETHDKLVTSFQGGLSNSIEVPINAGIVGYTATTGKILNIHDAYEDPRFNKATDLATGYRTLTLLCVPIFDDKHEIRGVTEMINKNDGVFTEEDEKLIQIFNVFCGISIENARLYRASIDLSLQLRSFFDISYSLSHPQTVKKMMEEILKNIRKVIGAVIVILYKVSNDNNFVSYAYDEDIEAKLKRVQKKEETTEDSLGVKRAIITQLMQGKSNDDTEDQKEKERRNNLVDKTIQNKTSIIENDNQNPEKSLIVVPIITNDRNVLGAVLMQWKKTLQKFTYDDQKLLESYSVFLSLSLERYKLKNITQLGTLEVELQNWIKQDERNKNIIPEKLKLNEEEQKFYYNLSFDISSFQGISSFKLIFNLFETFDLLNNFNIKSEKLFSFLYQIKESYNDTSKYHNWKNIILMTRFLAYLIYMGNLDKIFSKLEIFILFVTCLCNNTSYEGDVSKIFNKKAEIPLTILYKNHSVIKTHHCSKLISILTKDENNIFEKIPENQLENVWQIFVDLILSTDMSNHFEILNSFSKVGQKWSESENGRILMLKLLMKTADLSITVGEFDELQKCSEFICDEFFNNGDLSQAKGMIYERGYNDREHLDRQRSKIGFYKSVCLPMFETVSSVITSLSNLVDKLKANITKFEEIQAEEDKRMREERKRKEIEERRKREEEKRRRKEEERKKKKEEEDEAD